MQRRERRGNAPPGSVNLALPALSRGGFFAPSRVFCGVFLWFSAEEILENRALVPKAGLEPAWGFPHCPLKTACLPVPPLRREFCRGYSGVSGALGTSSSASGTAGGADKSAGGATTLEPPMLLVSLWRVYR